MKKINFIFKALLLTSVLFLASCNDDNEQEPKGDYENGVLITGEGSGAGSATISFVSNDYTTVESKIYSKVNGADLGTFLQSITFNGDTGYIVVDNQNTVTVVNRYTFEKKGEISTGLQVPRFMGIVGNKGYITNWGAGSFGDNIDDDFVAVVDLTTLQVTSKINVAVGPEQIVYQNGKMFVSHKGGYGSNNKVTVIDTTTDTVEKVIEVKDKPDELGFNTNGNLIVLAGGNEAWTGNETTAAIITINTNTLEVDSEVVFADGVHPSLMYVASNNIYYNVGNDVFEMSETATALPTSKLVTGATGFLYGIAVKDAKLYALDASFTDISKMNVFNVTTKEELTTVDAPLGASKVYFN